MTNDTGGERDALSGGLREPTLLDALIPAVTLALIAVTIPLFGTAATDAPLDVALSN